jgi:putative acetyltransferase
MEIEIIDYQPDFKDDFKRLNIEWISRYFVLEAPDLEQLDDPEGSILQKGGRIYMARLGEQIIGTITLKKYNKTVYELSKWLYLPIIRAGGQADSWLNTSSAKPGKWVVPCFSSNLTRN